MRAAGRFHTGAPEPSPSPGAPLSLPGRTPGAGLHQPLMKRRSPSAQPALNPQAHHTQPPHSRWFSPALLSLRPHSTRDPPQARLHSPVTHPIPNRDSTLTHPSVRRTPTVNFPLSTFNFQLLNATRPAGKNPGGAWVMQTELNPSAIPVFQAATCFSCNEPSCNQGCCRSCGRGNSCRSER